MTVIVAAEYLAKGYTLSDSVLSRAIEIDSQQSLLIKILILCLTIR